MAEQSVARPYDEATAWDQVSFYFGMTVKAFIFFLVVGYITYPFWSFLYDKFNFWNIPLMGVYIAFGLIFAFVIYGVVYSTLKRIVMLFVPKKK